MVTVRTMELYQHDIAGVLYYICIEHKYECRLSTSSTSDSDSPDRATPYQQIKPTTEFPINSKQQLHTWYIKIPMCNNTTRYSSNTIFIPIDQ